VADAVSREQFPQRAVAAIDEGVVREQAPGRDPALGKVREATFEEGGDGLRSLVAVELAVDVAGVVVDERVHPLVPDPHALLRARSVAFAGDGMAGACEASEALAVDVQEIAGAGPLVQLRALAGRSRRS
jgi:hypothetical protein